MRLISQGERRFKCQQSGHCCSNPNIIVTLTYRDLFRLLSSLNNDFRILLKKISFYTLKESSSILQKQMVLDPIYTSQGIVIPGLKKVKKFCVFFHRPNCIIYPDRPLSCRTYPLTFVKEDEQVVCTWVKNSKETCPGIGRGSSLSFSFIEKLGKRYFEDIEKHNQVVKELNIEADNNRPLTAREALWVLVTFGESEFKQERK